MFRLKDKSKPVQMYICNKQCLLSTLEHSADRTSTICIQLNFLVSQKKEGEYFSFPSFCSQNTSSFDAERSWTRRALNCK